MPLQKTNVIWMNGTFVPWDEAKVHVLTHALHYGSSWFEGIRCYNTQKGSAIFRLSSHIRRLVDSTRIFRATIPWSQAEIEKACVETVRANKLKACYIRPLAYRGYGEMGVNPMNNPVDVSIAVWEWGAYLGGDALDNGIDVCVSSWRRAAPDTFPAMAKSSGNYLNSQLMKTEALLNGFAEGIALDAFGQLSEGSGENLFIVNNNVLYTTPFASAILPGITRASVITLAEDLGYKVVETAMPREALYSADEVFFTGTAAEITPIRSVDRIQIGSGKPGPVAAALQKAFFNIVNKADDKYGWLTFI